MIIVDWNFNRSCNFNCDYCLNDQSDKKDKGPSFNIIKSAIDRLTKNYFFAFTGGELLLNPDFVKIASYITNRFNISLYTNLSLPLDNFIAHIDPNKVKYIVGSLHIKERTRLNIPQSQIVNQYKKLKDAGFKNIYIIQICDDYALSIYDELYDWYKEYNIIIIPNRLKTSPWYKFNYTDQQLKDMNRLSQLSNCDMFPYEMAIYKNNKDQPCIAGCQYIVILSNGRIVKCWGDLKSLGNFYIAPYFDESIFKESICKVENCACYPCRLNMRVLQDADNNNN